MKKKINLTTQAFIIISVLLLAANATLGFVMMNQSRNAMKTLIQQRMLDISNTAAASLDGDVLESLTAEDQDSEEYRMIMDALRVYQENIDLKYIYCITKTEDGNFVFSVDPTVEDPGQFGDPIVYTDALNQASLGTASVDDEPYNDDWGTFYSAYSPVFDSKGQVAGIVAVDFDAEWYDAQLRQTVLTILLSIALSLVIGVAIVMLFTTRIRRRFRALNTELGGLSAEVDELTGELSQTSGVPVSEKSDEEEKEASSSADTINHLGMRIRSTREELLKYINHIHTRENNMISALAMDYHSLYYVNLDTDQGVCYRSLGSQEGSLAEGELFIFSDVFGGYAEEHVAEDYKEYFRKCISPEHIRKELENESTITFHYLAQRNGKESYEMLRMAAVRNSDDPDDNTVHAISIGFTDVDKETRETMVRNRVLSEALTAAEESSKAKTAFLSNMSHEIRTPMNAIIGLDNIALSNPEISDRTRDELEKIGAAADHLLHIINDILDMSRIESGRMSLKKEEFYFIGILDQVNMIIGEQCEDKNITYACRISAGIDDYYIGDAVKIRQILINILGNAVKFTPEGGDVELVIERIARYEKNSTLRFTIADTGIGMDKDFIPHIFDAFSMEDSSVTSRHSSTGLGMAITKRIVEMMNGNIEVESEKGRGTTFIVTLTLHDADNTMFKLKSEDQHQTLRVLLVDADDAERLQTRKALEDIGIKSETAVSGERATESVRLHHARQEPYSLILIDDQLPDTDGVGLTRELRGIVGRTSVSVILIARDPEKLSAEAEEAGADYILKKPYQPSELLKAIKHVMSGKKADVAHKAEKAELKGKRILLAEDMPINAEIISMVLQMREIEVELAQNGRIAVDMFAEKPAGYYSAILMDMRMPEMDGLTATSAIRSMDREDASTIPIIALTANAFDEDVQRSLQAGLNAHLSKPVDPDKLFATLESLL